MAAEKDIIVALELASTAIRAIAGQRMPDGNMQVLAFVEENAVNCIRKGIIDNIDKTTQAISRVLGHIGLQIGQTVSRVYVGIGGQSMHSVLNRIQRTFNEKTQITNTLTDQLKDINSGVVYTDSKILDVIPQEYKVGNRTISDVVGMQVEQMEANFLNIIARNSLEENIRKCVKDAGYDIAELLISPITTGDTILSASEKRSGCALVDFGAETTTISVYTNNILRKLIVIPLGANNITMDIAKCLKIEHDEAETIKLKYGRAFLDNQESAQYNKIQLSRGREISESCLCEIIEARCEEIIRNIWKQIAEENSKLISGIVFTGGGAQLRQLAEAFQKITYEAQIRIVKVLPSDISLASGVKIIDFNRTYTLLSLLLHGNQNCVIHNVPTEAPDNTPIEDPTPNPPVPDTPDKEKEDNPEEENPEPKKTRIGLWGIIKKALTEEEDN